MVLRIKSSEIIGTTAKRGIIKKLNRRFLFLDLKSI